MSAPELIGQLLELPDAEAQKQFLAEHTSLLDDEVADALKRQADQFLRASVQRSLQAVDLLHYLAQLTGNPLHRAQALIAEGNARCLGGLGEYQRGIELYDEAAAIYQAADRPVEEARSQIGKIYALSLLGRHAEALETGDWARSVFEGHAQWRLLAAVTLNLGDIHGRLGEDEESLTLFNQAGELYRRLGEEGEHLVPWADHNRAIALRNLGRFDASIQAGQSALETLIQLGQRIEAARARQNLALTYLALGRYNEALELLEHVREVFLEDGRQRDAILVELYITDCLLEHRRFAQVLHKCLQIRGIFTELGTRFELAQALLNEAVAHAGLKRYDEAMASLAEAHRLFSEESNPVWMARTDLEKAALLHARGKFEASLVSARASADVFQAHSLPVRAARAHLIAGRALIALDRHDEACQLVHQALSEATSRDIPSLTYQGHHLLGTLRAMEGDTHEAQLEYNQAIQEVERLRGRLMVEFRVDFLEDKQAVYEDAVCLCLDTNQHPKALEYAERAKSRALLDLLAYRLDLSLKARGEADLPLVKELTYLRIKRDRLYRRWEGREEAIEEGWGAADESRQQTRKEVLALEKRITELWHKLLIRNADYARDASLWQVRTEPVQSYLEPDTVLLEYFFVHGQIVAFVATRERLWARRLPADLGEVQRLIRLLWMNLRSVPGSTSDQTSDLTAHAQGILRKLHKLLVAPIRGALATYHRLTIVPHGPLHYLPFHALYDGRRYLLQRYEVNYLPGASVLRYCQEVRPAASGLLALGHSYGGLLPYAVEETRAIAALLGDQGFVEDEATLDRLRGRAPNCRTVHLATHGEFRSDNPLFSGLALEDGWLTTLDIFNLHLNASLVTLSACQTGRNVLGGGDELLGLMRAFLYAGAASVLLSLWAVEDRSTANLMGTFYRKLAKGETKGAALRHAQRQLIQGRQAEDPSGAGMCTHPYYWAPFCLVGDAGAL